MAARDSVLFLLVVAGFVAGSVAVSGSAVAAGPNSDPAGLGKAQGV